VVDSLLGSHSWEVGWCRFVPAFGDEVGGWHGRFTWIAGHLCWIVVSICISLSGFS
jgi:hypothetical protein